MKRKRTILTVALIITTIMSTLAFPTAVLAGPYDGITAGAYFSGGVFIVNETQWMDYDGKLHNLPEGWMYAAQFYDISDAEISYHEGTAIIVEDDIAAGQTTAMFAAIDTDGNILFEMEAEAMGWFHDGLAIFKQNGLCGFVDKTGEVVIEPSYASLEEFSEGLAAFQDAKTTKWGFIDKTGKVVVKATYAAVYSEHSIFYEKHGTFSDGLAAVATELVQSGNYEYGDNWGYIDKKGKMVIKPQFSDVGDFHNGIARVSNEHITSGISAGELYFIDKKGNALDLPLERSAVACFEGLIANRDIAYNNKGKGMFQLPEGYFFTGDFHNGYAKIGFNIPDGESGSGFVTTDGKILELPVKINAYFFSIMSESHVAYFDLASKTFKVIKESELIPSKLKTTTPKAPPKATHVTGEMKDGTYTIQGKTSGLYVTVNPQAANDKQIYIDKKSNKPNQKFKLTQQDDGTFTIAVGPNGYDQVLDVANGSRELGADILVWDNQGSDNQRWYVTYLGDGYYQFINKQTNGTIDIYGDDKAAGTRIQQWDINVSDAQKFRLVPTR